MVDKSKCIGCGTCVNLCPVGAITFVDGKAYINKELCIKCHTCENCCPMNAIKIKD